jgi:hypothetical protein
MYWPQEQSALTHSIGHLSGAYRAHILARHIGNRALPGRLYRP